MLGNDVDPLGDAPAPRHAIESDEEEDEYNPLGERHVTPNLGTSVRVEYSEGPLEGGQPLAVVTGLTSVLLPLNEKDKRGEIVVNGVTVGSLHTPKYTPVVILASETNVRLPIWAMNAYAKAVLAQLQPSSVNILDTYAVPSYITDTPEPSPRSAPIRYLRTPSAARKPSPPPSLAHPFAPPNLLQSTTASFLSILNFAYPDMPATAVLLPAQHIPHPAPKDLAPSTIPSTDYLATDYLDEQGWDAEMLSKAVEMTLCHEVPNDVLLTSMTPKQRAELQGRRTRGAAVGEGGMYI
ncbi:uncharacterized protein SCHCODRAFT_02614711 [Schizophyllum commune H4-8]|uniref:Proteasome assembly chaperone 1 n=1 Tax=Schizophyllum commune (strain H4-8 / FGSC 9210) TaxID=578458 RepID=D8PZI3_SCHCM|nr:uncharacterized protein SCHCODRAFT_02614711 [Schizophyllum commune H4-8]KAI5896388.1 hypothetical protein SCHCODRAFT_02614711 [Schizophyllum commune H4-8]